MEKRYLPKRIEQRRKKSAARNEKNDREQRTGKTLNQNRKQGTKILCLITATAIH